MKNTRIIYVSLLVISHICASDAHPFGMEGTPSGAAGSGVSSQSEDYLANVAAQECLAALRMGVFRMRPGMKRVENPAGKWDVSGFIPSFAGGGDHHRAPEHLGRMLAICQVGTSVIDETVAGIEGARAVFAPMREILQTWHDAFVSGTSTGVTAIDYLHANTKAKATVTAARDIWKERLQTTHRLGLIAAPEVVAARAQAAAQTAHEEEVARLQLSSVTEAAFEAEMRRAMAESAAGSAAHADAAAGDAGARPAARAVTPPTVSTRVPTSAPASAAAVTETEEEASLRLALEMSARERTATAGAVASAAAGAETEEEASLRLALEMSARERTATTGAAVDEDVPLIEQIPPHMAPDFQGAMMGDMTAGARLCGAIEVACATGDTNPAYATIMAMFE